MRIRIPAIYIVVLGALCLIIIGGVYFNRSVFVDDSVAVSSTNKEDKKYIKWVDFDVCYSALDQAYKYDVETHGKEIELHWIELLAYLGTKYGGDFKNYKEKDMVKLAECLLSGEETMESLTKDKKYYSYYYEAYEAVLGGLVGDYEIQVWEPTKVPTPTVEATPTPEATATPEATPTAVTTPNTELNQTSDGESKDSKEVPKEFQMIDTLPNESIEEDKTENAEPKKIWEKRYGLKGFNPLARDYYYNDFDDFGVSRSYGYRRQHLGHDMMGSIGSPVIAVESGYVEAIGWNRYGGWRIGIRSFDGKRYYYYAHMRKDHPYVKCLKEGSIVTAGDVIGYLGRTGYSNKENVNNISTSHLHFGLQLIFDESQKEGNNEIWVDCYALTKFLYRNRSKTVKDPETKESHRVMEMKDPAVIHFLEEKEKKKPLDENAQDGVIIEYTK
ncbi:MAG: M23 family metallopeptidase [Clostridiales bacterium]|nr:M23 family metallopeptidase [Clostridiales bacterium]